jgi:hydroxymethylbilane synthase
MDEARVVRIGTRSSTLALRQAREVERALAARGIATELRTYETLGDRRPDEPLRALGAKGLFTKELEDDLLRGRCDCAVHSLKDLPTDSRPGLAVVALLPREDPRDALVVAPGVAARSLGELPRGARVGTSSLRRRAQLLALRPDLDVRELRGNVPTRVRKVDEGQVAAAILAAAGLRRLDMTERITAFLDPPAWLPAAGQGAIAVQARIADERTCAALAVLDDATTRMATSAERALLGALEGGCQVPIGALALERDGRWMLHGFISDLGGTGMLRGAKPLDVADPAGSGRALGAELLERGARALLDELRHAEQIPAPQPE